MTALQTSAPALCTKTALPNATVSEGMGPTTYSYLKIANGSGAERVTVLAIAGMHAREWAQPDAVISFAAKLLAAYQGNTAFVIPPYTDAAGSTHSAPPVPAARVKRIVDELDILLVPCANPDGRAFAQSDPANKDWRKNRAPRLVAADARTVGVDINRNSDIAWDYDVYYNAAFAATAGTVGGLSASKDPADERFIGRAQPPPNATHPVSEPEVRNLLWLLNNHAVTYSIDLHAYSMLVMFPWSIERNGTVATQHFGNAALNGTRDGLLGAAYSEYFPNNTPTRLLDRHKVIAGFMRDAVQQATGRSYGTGAIADTVYPATGTFADFHFSRQFTVPGSPPVHAFAAEFGDTADGFQPAYGSPHGFPKVEREIHAVLITLLESALPATPPAAPGGGGGTGSGGGGICIFSIAVADLVAGSAWLQTLRLGRSTLRGWRPTRGAVLSLERAYRQLGRVIAPHIVRRRWARLAIGYGVVAPAAAITAVALNRRGR